MDTVKQDVVVIGSGPAGYVAAIACAQRGLKTLIVEKYSVLGGTCLNVGCIPSKALLNATELLHDIHHKAKDYGFNVQGVDVDFSQLMQKKNETVETFQKGINFLMQKNGVKVASGTASFIDKHHIEVEGFGRIYAKHFIIATGSKPIELPFAPFSQQNKIYSSTDVLSLKEIPRSMVVIGAGVIGVELGSVYARLGTKVSFVESGDHICGDMEEAVIKELYKELIKQGMEFNFKQKVKSIDLLESHLHLETQQGQKFDAESVLVAIGRRPYTEGLMCEKAGIKLSDSGFIDVNRSFQTSEPHIYAIGDVIGGMMLAHKASDEGLAVARHLSKEKPHMRYISVPSVVYTSPEVASVGFTEKELTTSSKKPFKSFIFPLKANSRAKASNQDIGLVKLLVSPDKKILGGHIMGAHAGELIQEIVLAIETDTPVDKIAYAPHAHPTLAESLKEAALGSVFKAIHI